MENLRGHVLAMEVIISRMAAAIAQITENDSDWLREELEAIKKQLADVPVDASSEVTPNLRDASFAAAENIFEGAVATLDGKETVRFTLP